MKTGLVILLMILFVIGLAYAYDTDKRNLHDPGHDSRVKKILITCRDSAIRGALMGGVHGTWIHAFENACIWTFLGGTITGMSDCMGWHTKLNL